MSSETAVVMNKTRKPISASENQFMKAIYSQMITVLFLVSIKQTFKQGQRAPTLTISVGRIG